MQILANYLSASWDKETARFMPNGPFYWIGIILGTPSGDREMNMFTQSTL